MKNIPLEEVLRSVALSPNVVSRLPITEKYDKNVQGNTLIERGHAAVSVMLPFSDFPELPDNKKAIGVCVGTGGNPHVAEVDAGQAAAMGICQAALKVACVGGTWLGATDCLNFGNPEKEAQMGEFVAGVEGVKQACVALDIPIVSGNVSLYNESDGQSIPPSALVSVFGRVDNIQHIKPSYWATAGANIYRLGTAATALGGSEFNHLHNVGSTGLPRLDYENVLTVAQQLRELAAQSEVEAIIPIGPGGLWGALVGAGLKSKAGFSLALAPDTAVSDLLAEGLGAVVISSKELPGLERLGETLSHDQANINIGSQAHTIDLSALSDEWHHQLRGVF